MMAPSSVHAGGILDGEKALRICTKMYANRPVPLLAALGVLWLAGCSEGAGDLPSGQPASDAANGSMSDATGDEPLARPWVAGTRQDAAVCGPLVQQAEAAMWTSAFEQVADEQASGGQYLVSTSSESPRTPEYIEFCVDIEQAGRYIINTRVRAPSDREDSFFVTLGEQDEPWIYDVSRSDQFVDDQVSSREQNPLLLTLGKGPQVLRFHYREPNTALDEIRVELQPKDPLIDSPTGSAPPQAGTSLAQCAANTGLSEAAVQALLEQHLGEVDYQFVLEPLGLNDDNPDERRVDWRWDTVSGRANVMCLSDPLVSGFNLVDNSVGSDRLVIGSVGRDVMRFGTRLAGTFVGGAGADAVSAVGGGLFDGGAGNDDVDVIYDGTFAGGADDDRVQVLKTGVFNGGPGDDELITQFAGQFAGGPGEDGVQRQATGSTDETVELIGVVFEPLPAPERILEARPGRDTLYLQWTPSGDSRTAGYVVTSLSPEARASGAREVDYDIGLTLDEGVSGRGSQLAEISLDLFSVDAIDVMVRAYTPLDDGSWLYSEPLVYEWRPADDDDLADGVSVLATLDTDYPVDVARLAADGEGVASAPVLDAAASGLPIVNSYDARLQPQAELFDPGVLSARPYAALLGQQTHYFVTRYLEAEQARVHAFDAQTLEPRWELALAEQVAAGEGQCWRQYITADDRLVCELTSGGHAVFDADGQVQAYPLAPGVRPVWFGITGAAGLVVALNTDLPILDFAQELVVPPRLDYALMDTATGQSRQLSVDLLAALPEFIWPQVSAYALSADGQLYLAGILEDWVCDNGRDCLFERPTIDQVGHFIARVDVRSGELEELRQLDLAQMPGEGPGRFIGSVLEFDQSNTITRFQASTLEYLDRQAYPGTVQDASADRVLSAGSGAASNGDRLYLIDRAPPR